jgi:hypothetical protein
MPLKPPLLRRPRLIVIPLMRLLDTPSQVITEARAILASLKDKID